jgi:hypothetical protein
MTSEDELTRLRKEFAVSGPAPEPRACPPADRIWLAVRGELPPDELRELLDHVSACPACAEDWRIAMAFEEESRATRADPVPLSPSRSRNFRVWIVAAAMILAAVVGLRLHQPAPEVHDRGDGTAVESLVAKDASRPRDSFLLSWKPVPGATSYQLSVSTSGLTQLFQVETPLTSYQVPETALKDVPAGAAVNWQVIPVLPDGSHPQEPSFTTIVADPVSAPPG